MITITTITTSSSSSNSGAVFTFNLDQMRFHFQLYNATIHNHLSLIRCDGKCVQYHASSSNVCVISAGVEMDKTRVLDN